jgi:hypothetical protein
MSQPIIEPFDSGNGMLQLAARSSSKSKDQRTRRDLLMSCRRGLLENNP